MNSTLIGCNSDVSLKPLQIVLLMVNQSSYVYQSSSYSPDQVFMRAQLTVKQCSVIFSVLI